MLHEQGLDEIVCEKLGIIAEARRSVESGTSWCMRSNIRRREITIGMVGKYVELTESYKSLTEALDARRHQYPHQGQDRISRFRERSRRTGRRRSIAVDAILVPGGFGKRGTEGKIAAIRYARENNMPYLGICLGMQVAMIEFARNVAGLTDANSTEFDPDTPHPVVALINEWTDRTGRMSAAMRIPTSAARCASGRRRVRSSAARWRRESTAAKSTSAIAIVTRSTTIIVPRSKTAG